MFRVSTEAAIGLRCGIVALASAVALVSLFGSTADARGKRKFLKRITQSAASYEPRYADIVVDANTGDVLHSTSPDAQRHPASLTKIMTLYILFEQLESARTRLETQMDVSAHASSQAPTKLGVRPGQTLMVEDAIKALVTKSANDAAVVIAEHLAGSEDEFAKLMTRKARALRMSRTVYKNASGLPDSDQVTTARDQALLGLAIQDRFPRYYRYFSTQSFAYRGMKMANHNRLLGRVEGVTGIKTGYTRMSGFNLVSAVQRGERRIVAVVLGGVSAGARDAKMRTLIEQKVSLAAVKRTAPRITEIADAAPMPAPAIQAEKPVRVASAGAAIPPKPEQPATKPNNRAPEMQVAPAAPIDQPAPGSTEPIRPLLVKTLSVKAAAKAATAMSLFAPEPMSARSALVAEAAVEAPKLEAKSETLPPPPPGARPGVLGVLTARDVSKEAPTELVKDAPARTMTASIAPTAPAPLQPREIPARRAVISSARVSAPPAPPKVEIPTVADNKPRSGWILQVGAFEDQTEAKEKLAAARAKANSLLKNADGYTEVFSKGDKRYFRARFAGLKESSAEQACKELQKSKMSCFAVRN